MTRKIIPLLLFVIFTLSTQAFAAQRNPEPMLKKNIKPAIQQDVFQNKYFELLPSAAVSVTPKFKNTLPDKVDFLQLINGNISQ